MTIFDFINDILFSKKGDKAENEDDEIQFNGYLINRWLSMYSPDMAVIINGTTNWIYPIFETKQQYYKFMVKVIPHVKQRYIQYIKKLKPQEDEGEDENISILATNLELSEREIRQYLNK